MILFGWAGLAGTTFAAALLQAVSGFGFTVLAIPLYLLLVTPAQAVQLAIILSTALSFAVVPGLGRIIAPALLLRLSAGSLAGLPIGLFSFRHADRLLVRFVVGATILGFGVMMAGVRRRGGRARLGGDGRAAGADLSVAGRDGGANRARDASCILCAVIHTTQFLRLTPRPSASLAPPGWRPASLRPLLCWVALWVGRS